MAIEYYIREADKEEARGPFDISKLVSLAEAGQVTRETLYFDEDAQQWTDIQSNDELREQVFPEKATLSLKPKGKEDMESLNEDEDDTRKEVTVSEMLAAAEGTTAETRYVKEQVRWKHRAASMALPLMGFIMLISAFNTIYPNIGTLIEVLKEEEFALLQHTPFLVVGIIDALFAVFLFLGLTDVYPVLRIRMALGMGYYGFYHWAQYYSGDPTAFNLMLTGISGALGIYVATLTLNFSLLTLCGVLGFAGMGGYAFLTLFAG